jgi:protein-S-isoprenylcysteine O-methyltransferase Ste14
LAGASTTRAGLRAPGPIAFGAALAAASCVLGLLLLAAWAGAAFRIPRLDPEELIFIAASAAVAAAEAAASTGTLGREAPAEGASAKLARALGLATGVYLLALTAGPIALASGSQDEPSRSLTVLIAGSGLMVAGAGLRATAALKLGSRFSGSNAIAPGSELERKGPYRLFAHPSEVGLILLIAGGLCLVGRPVLWIAAVGFYGLTTLRLALEERSLCARYGLIYRAYRARTFDPFPSFYSKL